jgi:hypothetical protein
MESNRPKIAASAVVQTQQTVIHDSNSSQFLLPPIPTTLKWTVQQLNDDVKLKRGKSKRMVSHSVLFDSKSTIDVKIQKHIDLNLLSQSRNYKDTAHALLVRKIDEQFNPAPSNNLVGIDGENRDMCEVVEAKPNNGLNHVDQLEIEYDVAEESHRDLAIAINVDECPEIPSAIQYDPNAKPFLYATRRFFLFSCMMLTVVITGTIGVFIGIIYIQNAGAHTFPYDRTLSVRKSIELFISKEQLDDVASPYQKALSWITFIDPLALRHDDAKLAQRYVASYLYFATSSEQPWKTGCAPNLNDISAMDDRCQFLKIFATVDDFKVYESIEESAFRWLSGSDECDWAGVKCDQSLQIRSVDLSRSLLTQFLLQDLTIISLTISFSIQKLSRRFRFIRFIPPRYYQVALP